MMFCDQQQSRLLNIFASNYIGSNINPLVYYRKKVLVDQIEEVENSSKEVGGGEGEAEGKQAEEGEGGAVAEIAAVPRVPG